jgi:CheY-like chemotaxis protein
MSKKKPPAKYKIVMLVDDSEIDNFINQKMIEGCNFAEKIYVHTSGRSGLEFLRNIRSNLKVLPEMLPDLILLDINMPIMDGFQFAAEFDKLGPEVTDHCKIMILTSSMNPEDMQNSKKSPSVIRFVSKPLSKETLLTLNKD